MPSVQRLSLKVLYHYFSSCFQEFCTDHSHLELWVVDYDWSSGEYSSWTESRWETFSTRIFLQASKTQEVTVFVTGLIVFLLSIAITYWTSIKVDVIFPNR